MRELETWVSSFKHRREKSHHIHLLLLDVSVEGSHGLSKGISRALDFFSGGGSTLGLGAALTAVGAPLGEFLGKSLGHSLGEGVGGTLDVPRGIGRALHHVAALTGVGTPLWKLGVGGLDGGGTESGNDDGGELHFDLKRWKPK